MDNCVSPADLLATIRAAITDWANQYHAHSQHSIDGAFLSSLANDIAFELGILEAIGASYPTQEDRSDGE